MTTKASDIIRRSLKLLGVLAAGEDLQPEDSADCLEALNAMLGTWANERRLLYGIRRTTYTLTGASPETIGTGGTLGATSTRPLRIDGAGVIRVGDTVELPLRLLSDAEYQAILNKTLSDEVPRRLWVEKTYPAANLWLWPVPTSTATLVLYAWSRIASFAATDAVTLPDGYENALAHALALQVAPTYGKEPGQSFMLNYETALEAIQRTNAPDTVAELDPGLWHRGVAGTGSDPIVMGTSVTGSDSGVLY